MIYENTSYDNLIEKQNEAIFNFYPHLMAYLETMKKFLGATVLKPEEESDFDYDKAGVFDELLDMEIREKNGYVTNIREIEAFKSFSKGFYDFMLKAENNIPPTDEIKQWYANGNNIFNFLSFGITCDSGIWYHYNKDECKQYHEDIVKSMLYISHQINKRIEAFDYSITPQHKHSSKTLIKKH